jgi:hypothetical protein
VIGQPSAVSGSGVHGASSALGDARFARVANGGAGIRSLVARPAGSVRPGAGLEEEAMARYPNIADHGLISDLQTAALVTTDGVLDMLGVELDALLRLLRSRQFQQNVITGIIVLAALARLAKESQTHGIERLVA